MCLKESWFADCWKLLSVVLVLRMLGKGLQLKTTALLVFFQSYFQCGFWSSRLTADLQTVVSDRIARAFNRSGATRVVAFGIKPFNRVWHAGLLHKVNSYGISGQIFDLTSFFLSKRQLLVVLDGKSLQEYLVNSGVPYGSILCLTL